MCDVYQLQWIGGILWADCIPHLQAGEIQIRRVLNTTRHPIMQFTGLTDKNGKEIYEGDILQYTLDINKDFPKVVKWYRGCFGFNQRIDYFRSFFDDVDLDEYTVIGNIHENPMEGMNDK